jgi:hypothetical protein
MDDTVPLARARIDPATGRAAVSDVLAARGASTAPARTTLRLAVRFLLQLLVDRAPGNAVEVRVPPFAAAQAVPGPTHRRGTPSAVVETDPSTWVDPATGGLAWEDAVGAGLVRASGERADLGPWLPLLVS